MKCSVNNNHIIQLVVVGLWLSCLHQWPPLMCCFTSNTHNMNMNTLLYIDLLCVCIMDFMCCINEQDYENWQIQQTDYVSSCVCWISQYLSHIKTVIYEYRNWTLWLLLTCSNIKIDTRAATGQGSVYSIKRKSVYVCSSQCYSFYLIYWSSHCTEELLAWYDFFKRVSRVNGRWKVYSPHNTPSKMVSESTSNPRASR